MMVTFSLCLVGRQCYEIFLLDIRRARTMAQQEDVCLDACRRASRTGGHGCERLREGMNEHVHSDLLPSTCLLMKHPVDFPVDRDNQEESLGLLTKETSYERNDSLAKSIAHPSVFRRVALARENESLSR